MYIHSLTATPNDMHSVELTGRTRSINRKKWQYDELSALLDVEHTPNHEVFYALKKLMALRKSEPCFHPDSPQRIIDSGSSLFSVLRLDINSARRLLSVSNVTASPQTLRLPVDEHLLADASWFDLISDSDITLGLSAITLQPYQVMWLLETAD